jgi:hypothetical protein
MRHSGGRRRKDTVRKIAALEELLEQAQTVRSRMRLWRRLERARGELERSETRVCVGGES